MICYKMNVLDLPLEIIETISNQLNIIDFIKLKTCCKKLNEMCKIDLLALPYTDEINDINIYNDFNGFISDLTHELYDDIDENNIVLPIQKQLSMANIHKNYVLTINRNILFTQEDSEEFIQKYVYSFVIKKKNILLPYYENLYMTHDIAIKTIQNRKDMEVPMLLLYIGVKVLYELDGCNNLTTVNFNRSIPDWFYKILTSVSYPGYMLKDIVNNTIII